MTPPRRLLNREQRTASILRAAAKAFATAGFAATTMQDIAAEAGVTKLIIYRHFDSKQQLYEAVLDDTRTRLAHALNFRGREPNPDMIRPLVASARAAPEAFALLFRHAAREPRFARYAESFAQQSVAVADRAFEPLIADATVRRWLARLVLTLTIEGIASWMEIADAGDDDAFADRLLCVIGAVVEAVAAEGAPG